MSISAKQLYLLHCFFKRLTKNYIQSIPACKTSHLILFHNKMTEYSHSGIKHSSPALILIVERSPISKKIIMNRHFLPNDIC